jgi:hypothetical protein
MGERRDDVCSVGQQKEVSELALLEEVMALHPVPRQLDDKPACAILTTHDDQCEEEQMSSSRSVHDFLLSSASTLLTHEVLPMSDLFMFLKRHHDCHRGAVRVNGCFLTNDGDQQWA